MAAFSSSAEDPINRKLEITPDRSSSPSQYAFKDFYQIDDTAEWISEKAFKRVALQFPDELLHDSVPVYRALAPRAGSAELYVLADTSYGSCCVDEVAAQHVDADAIIHYGHACMSRTSRLPVKYVFTKKPFDIKHCAISLVSALSASAKGAEMTVELRMDVAYSHCMDELAAVLRTHGVTAQYARIPTSTSPRGTSNGTPNATPQNTSPPSTSMSTSTSTILYVGPESPALTSLLMTHSTVYSYDPTTRTAREESVRSNRLLMRRYAVLQRARDADVIGILVGTLGVASYLPLIAHLRGLLKRAKKRAYTVSVGKLNPAKLGNFAEVEAWVLVACGESAMTVDGKDFLRPIVTPYELEVALRPTQEWSGKYVLDFDALLSEATANSHDEREDGEGEDPDRPTFSLSTGTYRQAKRYGEDASGDPPDHEQGAGALVRRADGALVQSNGAGSVFLHSRTYQGLDPRLGADAPGVLEQGRSGIARGYKDDHPA